MPVHDGPPAWMRALKTPTPSGAAVQRTFKIARMCSPFFSGTVVGGVRICTS